MKLSIVFIFNFSLFFSLILASPVWKNRAPLYAFPNEPRKLPSQPFVSQTTSIVSEQVKPVEETNLKTKIKEATNSMFKKLIN